METTDAYTIAVEIANASGLITSLKNENTIEAQARVENIEELLSSVNEFIEDTQASAEETGDEVGTVTLQSYLENVALISDLEIAEDKKDDGNRISLMTVHSSKGLEFPYVYIIGMEENLFPSVGAMSESDVEEERRLFYVAMTRAEKVVSVSYAQSRFKWGQHTSNPPSRFLKEIDPRYLDHPIKEEKPVTSFGRFGDDDDDFLPSWSQRSKPRQPERVVVPPPRMSRPVREADPSFVASPVSSLKVGQRVEHDRFGFGRIVSMEGEFPNTKAVVDFEQGGEKTLLLKYAKLRIC